MPHMIASFTAAFASASAASLPGSLVWARKWRKRTEHAPRARINLRVAFRKRRANSPLEFGRLVDVAQRKSMAQATR